MLNVFFSLSSSIVIVIITIHYMFGAIQRAYLELSTSLSDVSVRLLPNLASALIPSLPGCLSVISGVHSFLSELLFEVSALYPASARTVNFIYFNILSTLHGLSHRVCLGTFLLWLFQLFSVLHVIRPFHVNFWLLIGIKISFIFVCLLCLLSV